MTDASALLPERCQALTLRERECLRLVLGQHSSKEIGRLLGVSQTSIDTYLSRARDKLGLNDRYAAARLFEQWERGDRVAPTQSATLLRADGQLSLPELDWRLPPLRGLDLLQRLALICMGAIAVAIVFGILLTALAAI